MMTSFTNLELCKRRTHSQDKQRNQEIFHHPALELCLFCCFVRRDREEERRGHGHAPPSPPLSIATAGGQLGRSHAPERQPPQCRPKKPHGPDPPSPWAQGLCLAQGGSQWVHGARGSPSSTAPHRPFARSLPCPGCIGVCVEGFIHVAAVIGILFSARTRGFPCSFVGSVRRRPRARPAPAPKCPACLLPPRRCSGSWHRPAASSAA